MRFEHGVIAGTSACPTVGLWECLVLNVFNRGYKCSPYGWVLAVLLVCGLLWLADRLDPLPLPKDDMARVVLAQDGMPLWRFAWTLNGTIPPTLTMGEPFSSTLQPLIWLNKQGLRVGKNCPDAQAQRVALWPAVLEPWLPLAEQRRSRLALIDPNCPPALAVSSEPIQIIGVNEGDRLQRAAVQQGELRLRFSAQGGGAQQWWYLNGRPLLSIANGQGFDQVFRKTDLYQLSVLDETGQTGSVQFSVVD